MIYINTCSFNVYIYLYKIICLRHENEHLYLICIVKYFMLSTNHFDEIIQSHFMWGPLNIGFGVTLLYYILLTTLRELYYISISFVTMSIFM